MTHCARRSLNFWLCWHGSTECGQRSARSPFRARFSMRLAGRGAVSRAVRTCLILARTAAARPAIRLPSCSTSNSQMRLRFGKRRQQPSTTMPRKRLADPRPGGALWIGPRLLNLQQAAAYLGLSAWSLRDYILLGLIPTVGLPPLRPREGERARSTLRRVLVDREDLDRFIDSRKAQVAGELQSCAAEIRPTNAGGNRTAVPKLCPKSGVARPAAP